MSGLAKMINTVDFCTLKPLGFQLQGGFPIHLRMTSDPSVMLFPSWWTMTLISPPLFPSALFPFFPRFLAPP